MHRVCKQREAEVIAAAFKLLPDAIADRLIDTHFLCADPLFVGLHDYTTASHDRALKCTAHCCYPWLIKRPASERVITVVLPTEECLRVPTVVHELGHVLHAQLGFEPLSRPVSAYARTNRWEAFAEAFTSWVLPGYARRPDPQTVALFEAEGAAS